MGRGRDGLLLLSRTKRPGTTYKFGRIRVPVVWHGRVFIVDNVTSTRTTVLGPRKVFGRWGRDVWSLGFSRLFTF